MTRLSTAQVNARIDAVEESFAAQFRAQDARIAALEAQLVLLSERHVQRSAPASSQDWPVVSMGGQRCYKVRAMEGGRMVTTYKPCV